MSWHFAQFFFKSQNTYLLNSGCCFLVSHSSEDLGQWCTFENVIALEKAGGVPWNWMNVWVLWELKTLQLFDFI